MASDTKRAALLDGLRVVDLSLWQPGHTATQLLADLGATVVKVEPPGGDRMRPLADRFTNYNGHKRSVVLDLKQPGDIRRFLGLVAEAEVVVENYRPGVADRLGVGFTALATVNPAIVLCSITGFGQIGPLAAIPGHDHNFQAYAGAFAFPAVGPPLPSALLVGDQGSGLAAAFAILAAVLCARRTGEGEHIDVAIADLLAAWVAPMGSLGAAGSSAPRAETLPGMGAFLTADGVYVELGVYSEDHLWDTLCDALGLPECVGLSFAERSTRATELRALIVAAVITRARHELGYPGVYNPLMGIGQRRRPELERVICQRHVWRAAALLRPSAFMQVPAAFPGLLRRFDSLKSRPARRFVSRPDEPQVHCTGHKSRQNCARRATPQDNIS